MSESSRSLPSARTFYDEVGGAPVFAGLVAHFYAGVRTDPVLAPLYPQDDWDGAEIRLRSFLEQYWGGPTTYSQERGHPRLRMRHAPFAIGPAERDAWLRAHARRPSTPWTSPPEQDATLWGYLEMAAAQHAEPLPGRRRRRPLALNPALPRHIPRSPVRPDPSPLPSPRHRLVAGRGVLPDLHPQLRRRERRRRGRPGRHPQPAAATWPTSASTPCGSRRSTRRRWPTTATTSPTRATSSRCSATWRSSTRCSPRRTRLGLRVTIDLVPNHSSHDHEWFQAALAAAPGSPERARYVFRDGRGADGSEPPNNWPSIFGGPAWTRVPDGQWYLHIFAPEQPDLNFDEPRGGRRPRARRCGSGSTAGVDGFRIDVAHGMAKPEGLPDMVLRGGHRPARRPRRRRPAVRPGRRARGAPPDPRRARRVPGPHGGRRGVGVRRRPARAVPPGRRTAARLQLQAAHRRLDGRRPAGRRRRLPGRGRRHAGARPAGCCPTTTGPGTSPGTAAARSGLRRARAAALLQLALPGAAYLYNGDELGLPNVDDLPDAALQDPVWERSGHTERGRDACRVPMPWSGNEPSVRVLVAARTTWLPMPAGWAGADRGGPGGGPCVDTVAVPSRAARCARSPRRSPGESLQWLPAPDGCLAFRRPGGLVCLLNLSGAAIPLPEGRVLLASADDAAGTLPVDAAVWLHGLSSGSAAARPGSGTSRRRRRP